MTSHKDPGSTGSCVWQMLSQRQPGSARLQSLRGAARIQRPTSLAAVAHLGSRPHSWFSLGKKDMAPIPQTRPTALLHSTSRCRTRLGGASSLWGRGDNRRRVTWNSKAPAILNPRTYTATGRVGPASPVRGRGQAVRKARWEGPKAPRRGQGASPQGPSVWLQTSAGPSLSLRPPSPKWSLQIVNFNRLCPDSFLKRNYSLPIC